MDKRSEVEGAATLLVAGETDLAALVRLAVEFRIYLEREQPSEASFRDSFAALLHDASVEFLLARDAAQADVGYLQCRYRLSAWSQALEAELEDVFVSAAARGRGLGQRLVELALERAAARGCRRVGLNTNERNRDALALYERLGFRTESARWDGGRQLWLERSLTL